MVLDKSFCSAPFPLHGTFFRVQQFMGGDEQSGVIVLSILDDPWEKSIAEIFIDI